MNWLKKTLLNTAPGLLTAAGSSVVIGNAINGIANGSIDPKTAAFQIGLGVIAIGIRRAIARSSK
jgi:hypothetical protein